MENKYPVYNLLFIACTLGVFTSAHAEPSRAIEPQWQYEFTPYIWGTGQRGTVGVEAGPGNGQSFDQSFSDILDRMDIAGMAAFEARYARWGILLDGIYLRVSDDQSMSGPNGAVSLAVDGSVTQQQYAAAAYYRAIEGQTTVDALAGLRYNIVRWDVDAQLSSPLAPNVVFSRNFSERKRWVDPYLGLRVIHHFDEQWSVTSYADAGGGGSGSKLTWQLMGAVNYAFNPNVVGKLGYRHVAIDYNSGGFVYDVATSGFYVGLGIRW